MKGLAIYRIAAAAIALCAAIAVADVAAANVHYQPTTGSFPSPTPSANSPKINLDTGGESDSEPDCDGDKGTCDIVIVIHNPHPRDVTVQFATRDGSATAGQDYNGVARATLTIPAGGTSAMGKVTIRADRPMAQSEFFWVRIFEPSLGEIVTSQRRMLIPMR